MVAKWPEAQLKETKNAKSGAYSRHNRVELTRGGGEHFQTMERLISDATDSIHLQTYILDSDYTGRRILAGLIKAARRKVRVYVMLDAYASQDVPVSTVKLLRTAGIVFHWFNPFFRGLPFYIGRRLHHKVLVVDSRYALVGGINISDRYNDIGDQKGWLDYSILAEGEVVADVQSICQARSALRPIFRRGQIQILPTNDICEVRARINDSFRRRRQIWNSYREMLKQARSHIVLMSPYFIPGLSMLKGITTAAKRGVKVQLLLGSESDVQIARFAELYLYPYLLKNGVEIYEFTKNILHGKMATYDGKWVTIGSYNMNDISAYASVELNLDVNDTVFAGKCETELARIISAHSVRITMERYERRVNWWNRMTHHISYHLIRALLFLFTIGLRNKE